MNNCITTQNFTGNANPLYKGIGMKGHGGTDLKCGWGTEIESPLDGYVYSMYDATHKASDGYYAVYMISQYKGQWGELCIGHLNPSVKIGDRIKKGDVLGTEGNHGIVYEDGVLITIAEQKNGSQKGHHRHWQWRPLERSLSFKQPCLIDYKGQIYKDEGYTYYIPNYYNGYNGLSPLIQEILDQGDWHEVSYNPASEAPVEVQSAFLKILQKFYELLQGIYAK